jgi:hypothetical protein
LFSRTIIGINIGPLFNSNIFKICYYRRASNLDNHGFLVYAEIFFNRNKWDRFTPSLT